jgi:type 1 glutamine amidotransferase
MAIDKLSRRSALRAFGRAGAGLGVASAVLPDQASAVHKIQKTTAVAFALIGDENHNSDYIRSALGSTLVEDAGLSIDFTDEEKMLSYENLKHYKILIIFRDGLRFPGGYWYAQSWNPKPGEAVSDPPLQKKIGGKRVGWMTDEQGRAVKKWVNEGGSLWAFHNNSQLSLMNKDYRDVEGAVYTGHPRIRPFKVKIVNSEHPITRGVKDFIVTDEQHFLTYEKDPKYVLARSVNEDGLEYTDMAGRRSNTCESVWAYEYGKGRVCFMAPGHAIHVMWNPEYEKMQKNAVKWLLHQS